MKKPILISLALLLSLSLAACGGAGAETRAASSNSTTVAQLLEEAAQTTVPPTVPAAAADTAGTALSTPVPRLADMDISSEDADVDLTLLSGTMVYSLVSQMMYEPEEFEGKTVKMAGTFNVFEGDERLYYSCLISDATACCANGIEFQWAGEHSYPEDYPEYGQELTVTGTFQLYEEDGFQYCQLADAQVTF